jgi:hypothetical protein
MLFRRLARAALAAGSNSISTMHRQWPAGQALPLALGIVAVLLGSVALGTDVAVHYCNWLQMQKAADAGVMAGANWLPDDPTRAISTAQQFAEANGIAASEITSTTVAPNDLSIAMSIQRTVPYYFAKALGMTNATLHVSATAAPQPPPTKVGCSSSAAANNGTCASTACVNTGDCQLIPIGLDYHTVYTAGEQITLQQGQVGPGNWDLLALGGVGGNNLRGNIADGYSGLVGVGDWVLTEPGKKVGPVDQGFQDRLDAAATMDPSGTASSHILTNPRVLVLPVVDWEDQNGRKEVEVEAFATVWLDSYGGGQVTVNFISQVIPNSYGSANAPDFGGHGHPVLSQ